MTPPDVERGPVMRVVHAVAVLVLAVTGSAVFWWLGAAVGMTLLLVATSLAIVGEGRRWEWAAIVLVLYGFGSVALTHLGWTGQVGAGESLGATLLACALMPVVPALVLWGAVLWRRFRSH